MKVEKDKKVLAVVTAYNEEDFLEKTINSIKQVPPVSTILVVDDGSTDDTSQIARNLGANLYRLKKNISKGRALREALKDVNADYFLLLDGDLGEYALEAGKILQPVLDEKADLAIARFPKPKVKGGFGLVKKLGSWAIGIFSGFKSEAPLSGQRALKAEVLKKLTIEPGFGLEVAMTIDTVRKGYKVVEIPVNMSHRETGRDIKGFIHRGRQFVDILKVVVKRIFKRY